MDKSKRFGGLTFKIDRPKGYVKRWPGIDETLTYPTDYGYLPGYTGEDGEPLDFFVGGARKGVIESFMKLKPAPRKDGKLRLITDRTRTVPDETKFLVGLTPRQRDEVLSWFTTSSGKPIYTDHRTYKDTTELQREIERFKDPTMHKAAASALRSRVQVKPTQVGQFPAYDMLYQDAQGRSRPIGRTVLQEDGSSIRQTKIDPAFRGLGLGKKMYGEVMRRRPDQTLSSDKGLSEDATRVWESMRKTPGYTVQQGEGWYGPNAYGSYTTLPPVGTPHIDGDPAHSVFTASLPAAAAIPKKTASVFSKSAVNLQQLEGVVGRVQHKVSPLPASLRPLSPAMAVPSVLQQASPRMPEMIEQQRPIMDMVRQHMPEAFADMERLQGTHPGRIMTSPPGSIADVLHPGASPQLRTDYDTYGVAHENLERRGRIHPGNMHGGQASLHDINLINNLRGGPREQALQQSLLELRRPEYELQRRQMLERGAHPGAVDADAALSPGGRVSRPMQRWIERGSQAMPLEDMQSVMQQQQSTMFKRTFDAKRARPNAVPPTIREETLTLDQLPPDVRARYEASAPAHGQRTSENPSVFAKSSSVFTKAARLSPKVLAMALADQRGEQPPMIGKGPAGEARPAHEALSPQAWRDSRARFFEHFIPRDQANVAPSGPMDLLRDPRYALGNTEIPARPPSMDPAPTHAEQQAMALNGTTDARFKGHPLRPQQIPAHLAPAADLSALLNPHQQPPAAALAPPAPRASRPASEGTMAAFARRAPAVFANPLH